MIANGRTSKPTVPLHESKKQSAMGMFGRHAQGNCPNPNGGGTGLTLIILSSIFIEQNYHRFPAPPDIVIRAGERPFSLYTFPAKLGPNCRPKRLPIRRRLIILIFYDFKDCGAGEVTPPLVILLRYARASYLVTMA